MPVFRYTGPDRTYPFLQVGKDQVAPVTVTDGDLVQLADAPDDGAWERAPKATATRLPDNDPTVIAAANEQAASVTPLESPDDVAPVTAFDSTHDHTNDQAEPAATTGE